MERLNLYAHRVVQPRLKIGIPRSLNTWELDIFINPSIHRGVLRQAQSVNRFNGFPRLDKREPR